MTMIASRRAAVWVVALQCSGLAVAAPTTVQSGPLPEPVRTCASPVEPSLLDTVSAVGARLKKSFLIDQRLDCVAVSTPVDVQKTSYRDLQALLALYGFVDSAAADGSIYIVPEAMARQLPMRIIDDKTRDVGDAELVMKIIDPSPLNAAPLVPILRPLLPQYAHLVTDTQTNSMIVVARYGNIRTLEAMLRSLQQRPLVTPAEVRPAK